MAETRVPGWAGWRVGGHSGRALQSEVLENPWLTTETMTGLHLNAQPPLPPPEVKGQWPRCRHRRSPLCGLTFPVLPLAAEWAAVRSLRAHPPRGSELGTMAITGLCTSGSVARGRPAPPLPSLLNTGVLPAMAFEKTSVPAAGPFPPDHRTF